MRSDSSGESASIRRTAYLFLITACLTAGCSGMVAPRVANETVSANRAPVRMARVTRGDVTGVLIYSGELRAKPLVTVTSKITGRIDQLHVEIGGLVREGDALIDLDRAGLEVQVVQAQAALAAAEARLAGLQAGDDPEELAEAEAHLRAARARLAVLEASPRAETIPQLVQNLREARRRLAELENNRADAVAQAEARLASARSRLDQLLSGSSPGDATPASIDRVLVEQARAELARAEQDLARARRPVTSEEIAAAREQVLDAEEALLLARNPVGPGDLEEAYANVEAAEARLRRAGAPASAATIKAAQTAVEHAWAALELARLQLRESSIVSPVRGIVAEIPHARGTAVAAGTPLVGIQLPDLDLVLAIEDRHIGQVQVGQAVNVVVDAYPNESFTGTVRAIAPAVDLRTRTIATKIEVVDPQLKLKSGLFAQAAIAGPRRQGTLLVPREAVLMHPEPSVMQVVDGRARRHRIQVGVSDGRQTEVLQGLAEGVEVIASPVGIYDGDLIVEP